MKKGLALVLTAAFCVAAVTGCGSSSKETKAETKAETSAETTAETGEETSGTAEAGTKLTVAALSLIHILICSIEIKHSGVFDNKFLLAFRQNIQSVKNML